MALCFMPYWDNSKNTINGFVLYIRRNSHTLSHGTRKRNHWLKFGCGQWLVEIQKSWLWMQNKKKTIRLAIFAAFWADHSLPNFWIHALGQCADAIRCTGGCFVTQYQETCRVRKEGKHGANYGKSLRNVPVIWLNRLLWWWHSKLVFWELSALISSRLLPPDNRITTTFTKLFCTN